MSIINKSQNLWNELTRRLNVAGAFVPQLFLRLILFWEFWEAGKLKYDNIQAGGEDLQGTIDWFAGLNFPFPFDQISASANYTVSMFAEIFFAILILLGLFTRFAAISLIIVTVVATAAVHWPESWSNLSELWQGYAISNKGFGNYKLPLLYVIMLMPLLFNGAGKLSLDALLGKMQGNQLNKKPISDAAIWGLIALVLGATFVFVMPLFGGALILLGVVLVALKVFVSK